MKQVRRRWNRAFVVGLSVITFACGQKPTPSNPHGDDPGSTNSPDFQEASTSSSELDRIRDRILSIEKIPVESAQDVVEAVEAFEHQNSDSVRVKCSRTPHRTTNVFDSIAAFDPTADVLWPGSLVQGKSLPSAVLAPIQTSRAPGTLTLIHAAEQPGRASGPTVVHSRTFSPSLANAKQAAQEILRENLSGSTPARMSYQFEEFHSFEQAMLKIGASAEWMTGGVRAQLESAFEARRQKYVVSFVQAYYTLAFEPPESPVAIFDPRVKLHELAPYMEEGNPPAYISSVTYGRMLVLLIDSHETSNRLRAALQAAFSGVVASGRIDVSAEHRRALENSSIRILSLGGAAGTAIELLASENKLEALEQYFKDGADFSATSPGVPISYQARYLKDNSAARISFTADYVVETCVTPKYVRPATVTIDRLEFHDTADDDEDVSFYVVIELLRQDGAVATRLKVTRGETYVEEPEKVGWRNNKNKFFMGSTKRTNEAVFAARVTVHVRTHDGDGKRWGTNRDVFHAPFRAVEQMDGGHDGHWRLLFRIR
jgi:hypothetical protein